MNVFTNLCRSLRDLGIFFAGLALLLAALDYFYLQPDPTRKMQREMSKAFGKSFSEVAKAAHQK